ncbi:hypothetical protein ACFFX0_26620 [Citricoccus parietis]|uniref:Secreted protein n=1 Tax=Citricoccus parietis TaxID=592307 RepID=A0ABV5G7H6_9MICC
MTPPPSCASPVRTAWPTAATVASGYSRTTRSAHGRTTRPARPASSSVSSSHCRRWAASPHCPCSPRRLSPPLARSARNS